MRAPTRTGNRGLFWTLAALSMFGPLAIDMYLPGLPSLTRDLHTSAAAGDLTLTGSVLGIALGQLVAGPISDARGRVGPLQAGLIGFIATSVLCAVSPSVWPLVAARFVQGLCGGSSIVIARAVVRDLFEGIRAAKMFATLVMLTGVAPVLAPLIGGGVLTIGDWRWVFVVLAAIGVAILAAAVRAVPETLPPERRRSGELREVVRGFGRLLRDRSFAPYMSSFALSFCVMFAYISGGSYVLENVYGVSPQVFSAIFATNALAFTAASRVCMRLTERLSPQRLTRFGLLVITASGIGALLVTALHAGIWPLLIVLFVVLAANGIVLPSSMSAAMASQDDDLGSASGLLGLTQFGFGAALAPLVGLGGSHDALPMGIAMAACGVVALLVDLAWAA